ncbi:NAD(P)-binding domain-containing protein [Tersicoccus sp. MR15.9]|uniref:flavin-containing monooxygenase n=1 Tax=Tersicoccus mangrovi TaxID=3121635 RepID=UPI002FE5EFAF
MCVIGAGCCGLTTIKALAAARIPFACYEQGSVIGGNWVYRNTNGRSACYDSLEINTSCPRMAFSDFPMPADYPPYAMHHQVAAYFAAYADHFRLRDRITFGTTVEHVRPAVGGWDVTIRTHGESAGDAARTERFDAVVVANGHHWDARWPDPAYPGTFDGEQMHSHEYRSAEQLAGRDVVVVGSGNSAMDIAVAAARVGRSATISQRRGEWVLRKFLLGRPSDQIALPGWMPWWATRARLRVGALLSGDTARLGLPRPGHAPGQSHPVQSEGIRAALRSGRLTPRPGIARFDGRDVVFVDGSRVPADLIIWATGYRVSFPFLDDDLLTVQDNDLPLWKRVIHPDLPGLYFVGLLQPVGAVMPLAEAQGAWIADLVSGAAALPDADTIRTELRADDRIAKRRFYRSPRHTMEVDFDHYRFDLRREQRRGRRRAARNGVPERRRPGATRHG